MEYCYMALLIVQATAWTLATSLQCWKCIGKSCHVDPADNYRASKTSCRPGESCMKVYYQQRENDSFPALESTILACSSGKCVSSTDKDFDMCLHHKWKYNVLGCAFRSCCDDFDLCNVGNTITVHWEIILCYLTLTLPLLNNVT